jgi:hypothetical protein
MTPAQRTHFYFPKWLPTAARLDWVMVGGRLLADVAAQFEAAGKFSPLARDLVRDIIVRAQALAAGEHRAVTADDLRHACNLVASQGRTASATKLSNAELNAFDRLCAVLRRPFGDDLTPVIPFVNPAEDNRQRSLQHLRKLANEGRLRAIAKNTWGISDWEGLDQARLDALIAEIKKNAWPKYPRGINAEARRTQRAAKVGQPF